MMQILAYKSTSACLTCQGGQGSQGYDGHSSPCHSHLSLPRPQDAREGPAAHLNCTRESDSGATGAAAAAAGGNVHGGGHGGGGSSCRGFGKPAPRLGKGSGASGSSAEGPALVGIPRQEKMEASEALDLLNALG